MKWFWKGVAILSIPIGLEISSPKGVSAEEVLVQRASKIYKHTKLKVATGKEKNIVKGGCETWSLGHKYVEVEEQDRLNLKITRTGKEYKVSAFVRKKHFDSLDVATFRKENLNSLDAAMIYVYCPEDLEIKLNPEVEVLRKYVGPKTEKWEKHSSKKIQAGRNKVEQGAGILDTITQSGGLFQKIFKGLTFLTEWDLKQVRKNLPAPAEGEKVTGYTFVGTYKKFDGLSIKFEAENSNFRVTAFGRPYSFGSEKSELGKVSADLSKYYVKETPKETPKVSETETLNDFFEDHAERIPDDAEREFEEYLNELYNENNIILKIETRSRQPDIETYAKHAFRKSGLDKDGTPSLNGFMVYSVKNCKIKFAYLETNPISDEKINSILDEAKPYFEKEKDVEALNKFLKKYMVQVINYSE